MKGSAGRGARAGDHPSRSEARECKSARRRHGQGVGFRLGKGARPRPGAGPRRDELPHVDGAGHSPRVDHRHCRLDGAGTGPTNRLGVTPGSGVWRPDLVGHPGQSGRTADAWLNAAAFAVPQNPDGTYRFGDLGRNSLAGPVYFNLDAALMRDMRIGRTLRLQLRWETFNATNHPSYGLPNAALQVARSPSIQSTLCDIGPGSLGHRQPVNQRRCREV